MGISFTIGTRDKCVCLNNTSVKTRKTISTVTEISFFSTIPK